MSPKMKPVVLKKTFRGRGPFPVDMLRYDCCWPASSEDVQTINTSFLEWKTPEIRTVTVKKVPDKMGFTMERWKVYGWEEATGPTPAQIQKAAAMLKAELESPAFRKVFESDLKPRKQRQRCPVCKVDRTYSGVICPPCQKYFEVGKDGHIHRKE